MDTVQNIFSVQFSDYIEMIIEDIPQYTSTNVKIIPFDITISSDENIVIIIDNTHIWYKINDGILWSSFTLINKPDEIQYYNGCRLTLDGNKCVIITDKYCYFFTWENENNSYSSLIKTLDNNIINYIGLDMTPDGSRIVIIGIILNEPTIYYADWDYTNYNYNDFISTDINVDPTNINERSITGIGISANGSKIAYQRTNNIYVCNWIDGKYSNSILIDTNIFTRHIKFSLDDDIILCSVDMSNFTTVKYSIFNGSTYATFIQLPQFGNQLYNYESIGRGLVVGNLGSIYIFIIDENNSYIYKTTSNITIDFNMEVDTITPYNLIEPQQYDSTIAASNLTKSQQYDSIITASNLARSNLTKSQQYDSIITASNLARSNLIESQQYDSTITASNLARSNLIEPQQYDSTIAASNLTKSQQYDSIITASNLARSNLTKSQQYDSIIAASNLARSNLTKSQQYDSTIAASNLARSNLTESQQYDSTIAASNLTKLQQYDSIIVTPKLSLSQHNNLDLNISDSQFTYINLPSLKITTTQKKQTQQEQTQQKQTQQEQTHKKQIQQEQTQQEQTQKKQTQQKQILQEQTQQKQTSNKYIIILVIIIIIIIISVGILYYYKQQK